MTRICRACGVPLAMAGRNAARARARYCSRACYHAVPPKLSQAAAAAGAADVRAYLLGLVAGRSLDTAAALAGVHRQAFTAWLDRWGVVRLGGAPQHRGVWGVRP